MIDRDLAGLYGVTTKVLNQAVKRNPNRLPADFMFQLTFEEVNALQNRASPGSRSQIVTLKQSRGQNLKYQPYAFTEHGILMLSSVLKSERAVQVNIEIMRAFVYLRELLVSNVELAERLDQLESEYDGHFKIVFQALRQLMAPAATKKNQIGFTVRAPKK
jgi:hypothetical protein